MRYLLASLMTLTASTVWADGCPVAPDHSAALDRLLADVQVAPNEMTGQQISNEMWQYWADAPDEASQALLDEGMRARRSYDFVRALNNFDRLVDYCPRYAEGYNQRAFVNFLRQDFSKALVDLDLALEINPKHVAALAGKALTLIGLERHDEAQIVLREAVDLNPWLSERSLLTEPPGQEL